MPELNIWVLGNRGLMVSCIVCCAVAGVIGMSLVLAGGNSVIWLKHTSTFIYITGQAISYLSSPKLLSTHICECFI